MPETYCTFQNHLLAALPTAEFNRVSLSLELVHLSHGEVLRAPGDAAQHICSPTATTPDAARRKVALFSTASKDFAS